MTIEDFITVMLANKEQYPEFAILTRPQQEFLANLNIITGVSESCYEDGKLIGVSGMRYIGIGEIWGMCLPEIRNDKKFLMLKQAKKDFVKIRDELNLWRVFADSTLSDNFLKHLGFNKSSSNLIWTKGLGCQD